MSHTALANTGPSPAPRPSACAPRLSALVTDGLARDADLYALGERLMAMRLVFPAAAPKRCCTGAGPAFIAIGADDPGVPDRVRRALGALAPGRAVPGAGLRALAGGLVALPGLTVELEAPSELGPGLEHVVVLALADAARGLVHAAGADAMTPRTVAVVRGGEPPPAPWRAASGEGEWVALDAGLTPFAERTGAV